jgi:hypothetical protein
VFAHESNDICPNRSDRPACVFYGRSGRILRFGQDNPATLSRLMTVRPRKLILPIALVIGALGASVASADFLAYKNTFSTRADLLQMKHLFVPGAGTHCKRALAGKKMRATVGRSTVECDFSPPVVADSGSSGGNFNIAATIVLSPRSKLPKKTFMSVGLRVKESGGGSSKYRLDVSPATKRFALRKYQNGEKAANVPGNRVYAQGKRKFINTTGIPNRIGLKVTNDAAGSAVILAKINGRAVASTIDSAALDGKLTEIAIGRASGSAEGAAGTFDTVSIQSAF